MLLDDDVTIKSFVAGTFLHGAAEPLTSSADSPRYSSKHEVNMAAQVERWRLFVYSLPQEVQGLVLGGGTVRLWHFEESGFVAGDERHENGIALQRVSSQNEVDSSLSAHTLWEIENADKSDGGPVEFFAPVRLRHLTSGMLLGLHPGGPVVGDEPGVIRLALVDARARGGRTTEFTVVPTRAGESGSVKFRDGFRLVHADTNKHVCVSWVKSAPATLSVQLSDDATVAILAARDAESVQDVFCMVSTSAAEVRETLFISSCLPRLRAFVVCFDEERFTPVEECRAAFETVAELSRWVQDADGAPIRRRQKLLREKGLLRSIVDVLSAPFRQPGPYVVEQLGSAKDSSSLYVDDDSGDGMLSQFKRLATACYDLLLQFSRAHVDNQRALVKHMPTFIGHLGLGVGVEDLLYSAMQENPLFSEGIAADDVKRLIDFIRSRGKRAEALLFLSSLCSCNGIAIGSKQELISDCMFGEIVDESPLHTVAGCDIVLPTRVREVGSDGSDATAACGLEVYIGALPAAGDFRRAADPPAQPWSVDVAAYWKRCAESMLEAQWMDVTTLFQYARRTGEAGASVSPDRDARRVGHAVRKRRVVMRGAPCVFFVPTLEDLADYFVAQLRLFTEMCVGRNYLAINAIKKRVSCEAMFRCVRNASFPDPVRAQFCRLLNAMYLNVMPQVGIPVCIRTRAWRDVVNNEQAALPQARDVVPFNMQLRDYISAYLIESSLPKQQSDLPVELLLAVLQVCCDMFRFGMLSDRTMIERLVPPLVGLLEYHTPAPMIAASVARDSVSGRDDVLDDGLDEIDEAGMAFRHSMQAILLERTCMVESKDVHTPPWSAAMAGTEQESSALLVACKIKVCDILLFVCRLRLEYQITRALQHFYKNAELFSPSTFSVLVDAGPYVPRGRAASRAAKVAPFGGVGHAVEQAGDFFERIAKNAMGSTDLEVAVGTVVEIANSTDLSIEAMCENLTDILITLSVSGTHVLVLRSLELMQNVFRPAEGLLQSLSSIQLLVDSDAIAVYDMVQQVLPRALHLCETSEMWLHRASRQVRLGRAGALLYPNKLLNTCIAGG